VNNELSNQTTTQDAENADENPSEQFAELLKNFIPPTDVILGIPLEFEYKEKKLKIHGRASYYLRMIDKDIEELRATYSNQPSMPEPLTTQITTGRMENTENTGKANDDKEKSAYEKAVEAFHKARGVRSDKIYDLIEEILFKILNEDWKNPDVDKDWIAKNIPITLGDYVPPHDAPLGLPSAWFSEDNQEQFPIALRILNTYPLRQNPNHLLKNVLRARIF